MGNSITIIPLATAHIAPYSMEDAYIQSIDLELEKRPPKPKLLPAQPVRYEGPPTDPGVFKGAHHPWCSCHECMARKVNLWNLRWQAIERQYHLESKKVPLTLAELEDALNWIKANGNI